MPTSIDMIPDSVLDKAFDQLRKTGDFDAISDEDLDKMFEGKVPSVAIIEEQSGLISDTERALIKTFSREGGSSSKDAYNYLKNKKYKGRKDVEIREQDGRVLMRRKGEAYFRPLESHAPVLQAGVGEFIKDAIDIAPNLIQGAIEGTAGALMASRFPLNPKKGAALGAGLAGAATETIRQKIGEALGIIPEGQVSGTEIATNAIANAVMTPFTGAGLSDDAVNKALKNMSSETIAKQFPHIFTKRRQRQAMKDLIVRRNRGLLEKGVDRAANAGRGFFAAVSKGKPHPESFRLALKRPEDMKFISQDPNGFASSLGTEIRKSSQKFFDETGDKLGNFRTELKDMPVNIRDSKNVIIHAIQEITALRDQGLLKRLFSSERKKGKQLIDVFKESFYPDGLPIPDNVDLATVQRIKENMDAAILFKEVDLKQLSAVEREVLQKTRESFDVLEDSVKQALAKQDAVRGIGGNTGKQGLYETYTDLLTENKNARSFNTFMKKIFPGDVDRGKVQFQEISMDNLTDGMTDEFFIQQISKLDDILESQGKLKPAEKGFLERMESLFAFNETKAPIHPFTDRKSRGIAPRTTTESASLMAQVSKVPSSAGRLFAQWLPEVVDPVTSMKIMSTGKSIGNVLKMPLESVPYSNRTISKELYANEFSGNLIDEGKQTLMPYIEDAYKTFVEDPSKILPNEKEYPLANPANVRPLGLGTIRN